MVARWVLEVTPVLEGGLLDGDEIDIYPDGSLRDDQAGWAFAVVVRREGQLLFAGAAGAPLQDAQDSSTQP